jgi:hypothetical protein
MHQNRRTVAEEVEIVEGFVSANGSILMTADDIRVRTGLSIGAVNRALLFLHRNGRMRRDSHTPRWTNIGLQLAAATG